MFPAKPIKKHCQCAAQNKATLHNFPGRGGMAVHRNRSLQTLKASAWLSAPMRRILRTSVPPPLHTALYVASRGAYIALISEGHGSRT